MAPNIFKANYERVFKKSFPLCPSAPQILRPSDLTSYGFTKLDSNEIYSDLIDSGSEMILIQFQEESHNTITYLPNVH